MRNETSYLACGERKHFFGFVSPAEEIATFYQILHSPGTESSKMPEASLGGGWGGVKVPIWSAHY